MEPDAGSAQADDRTEGRTAGSQLTPPTVSSGDSQLPLQGILDGLTQHIAITDENGRILVVNERWRDFAREGGAAVAAVCEGANYLAACDASAPACPEAGAVAAGLRAVLAGNLAQFSTEYPCPTPTADRWFLVRITAASSHLPRRAVIAHEDVTARRMAAKAAQGKEAIITAFIRQAPASIVMFDRKMNYLAASHRWISEYGRGHAYLTGLNHYDLFPDLPPRLREIHRRGLAGEEISETNDHWVTADGSEQWVSWTMAPWRDASGSIGGIIILTDDITPQKKMERKVQESEARFGNIIQLLPAAVYTCDSTGRIELFNAAAVRLWGRGPDPDQDRWGCAHRLLTADGSPVPRDLSPVAICVKAGKPSPPTELVVERSDGSRSHVLAFPQPLLDTSGAVTGAVNMLFDVTLQKAAEQASRENENRLRLALEAGRFGTFEWDVRSGEVVWSDEHFRALGYRAREIAPSFRAWADRVHPEDLAATEAALRDAMNSGKDYAAEYRTIWPDGTIHRLEAFGRFQRDDLGKAIKCYGLVRDITRRWQAESALAQANRRIESIVETAMDAIISVDSRQRIVLFNAAAEKMFRCPAREAIGGPLDRFIPPRFRAAHAGHHQRFIETGVTARAMGRLGPISGLRGDGEEFPLEASISTSEIRDERISTVIIRDVTERKRLEQEVLEIRAHEQRRIGQELHDDICQWLAGVEFLSTALAGNLAKESPRHEAAAQQIAEVVRQTLTRARSLSHGLAPTIPPALGLAGVLRELAKVTATAFGIRCHFEGPEQFPVRSEPAALHLYRIAQEAVANAARHSGASEIRIELSAGGESPRLCIRDNGRGLPPTIAMHRGMGMSTLRYRAGIIGGTLEIRTGTGGGTEIICEFPRDL